MADPVELILDFLRRHRFLQAEAAFMAELLSREEDGMPPSPSESVLHQNPQLQSFHDIQCTIGVSGNAGDENLRLPLHRGNAGSSTIKKASSFQEDARFPPEKQLYVEYEPGRVISPDRFCTASGDFHGEDTSDIPKGEVPLPKSGELVTPPIQALDQGRGGANHMVSKILQAEHAVTRLNKAPDKKQQSDLTSNSVGIQLPIQNQEYHKDELKKDSAPCTPALSCKIESKKSALKRQDKATGLDLLIEGQVASGTNRVEHCMELSLQGQNSVSRDLLDKGVEGGSVAKVLPCFSPKAFDIAEQQMLLDVEEKTSLNETIRKNCISNSGKVEAALSEAFVNGNSGLRVDSKALEFTTSVHESGELRRSLVNQNSPKKNLELNVLENNDGMHEETLGLHTLKDTLLGMNFLTSGSKPSMLRPSVSQGIVEALPDHLPAISNAADGWYPDDHCDSDTYEDDDDPGYHRQPIEDEEWFLANEIDYPSDEERPKQCTDKLSLKNAIQSTKIEEDGVSYGEEESYFSGEEYYGLHSAKEDYRKPHFSELRGLDENLTSLNVQQVELDKGKLAMLGNDIMTNKIEEEGFETREPDLMCPMPAWKGFAGHPINCDEYDSGIDGCKINADADDDNRGSVRSGGIFISSDIADVGSEQRDSLVGGSSEGDVESLQDQPLTTSKLVTRSFESTKSNNYGWEMPTELKNTSDQHYEESSSEHDLVLQYYNEAWGLCKRSTDKELASRSILNSNKLSGNKQLTDSRNMRLYDNGGSMFEGFSFPSPSSKGEVAISAEGSGRSLQSNRECTVQANETDGYGAAMVGPDDTLAAWRQKSNNSSPIVYSSEDNLQSFELPDHLNGSLQSTDYHENLLSKYGKHGDEEAKLDCQLGLSQLPMQGEEDAFSGHEEMKMLKNTDDYFEVFNLRVIHRKNRTGFEEEKDFPITINSIIAGRYHVTEYLGSAAFSKAIQAHDLHTGMDVCMKIIKNNKDFFDQSLDEIKLLKFINQQDPADKYHILRLYDYFYHREHLFIVCELLRANLYEFHKFNRESGGEVYFTLPRIQSITRQCLEALEYLHRLGIIHCDLKPENILVKSYSRCEVKIIDLGSSCFETDHLCSYVQSRSYRAPEVILGLPYDQKIDIWSLGCILAELCTGNETDQLEYLIPKKTSLTHRLPLGDHGFVEFVGYLLQCNPSRRPSATAALQHPWLSFPYEPISS